MHGRLRRHVAAVAVPGHGIHVIAGDRVGQHAHRFFRFVPVVVPVEDQGAAAAPGDHRAQVVADQPCSRRCVQAHAGIVLRLVVRLVLHGQREDGYAFGGVGIHVPQQVAGKGIVVLRQQAPVDQAVAVLHPARRAPWRGHDLQLRVDGQHGARDRNNVAAVLVDAEVLQVRVRRAVRRVVEAVVVAREVGRADGQTRKTQAQAVAFAAEQLFQQRVALARVQRVLDQPGGRIGQRSAEADDLLEALRVVDHDLRPRGRPSGETRRGRRRQCAGVVGGGDPYRHVGGSGLLGGPRRTCPCRQDEAGEQGMKAAGKRSGHAGVLGSADVVAAPRIPPGIRAKRLLQCSDDFYVRWRASSKFNPVRSDGTGMLRIC